MTLQDTQYTPSALASRRNWSVALLEENARSRAATPGAQLLSIFDILDDLVRRGDREARRFLEALANIPWVSAATPAHLDVDTDLTALIEAFTFEAELHKDTEFAPSYRLLLDGALSKAINGDHAAPLRAKAMVESLIQAHRPALSIRHAHPVQDMAWQEFDLDAYADGMPTIV